MKYKTIDSKRALKWCFLGCGNITKSHAKALSNLKDNIELSFASRSIDKAKSYKDTLNGVQAFGNYNEAIQSDEVDVIMINTPPNSHFDLAKSGLENGKHVVVEKPPFFKSSDFDVLGKLADDNGLQLIVAENYFYKPLRYKIESLLQSKIIGDPLFLHINATKKQASKNDWREDKSITGFGALFEGGIHWINFINHLGFEITDISGLVPGPKKELERSIQVTANTSEGLVMNLQYSWEVDTLFKGLRISRILGSEGSITFESNGVFYFARGQGKKFAFPDLLNISGQKKMLTDFVTSIRAGHPPQFDWKMAQNDLKLIETIYSSINRG